MRAFPKRLSRRALRAVLALGGLAVWSSGLADQGAQPPGPAAKADAAQPVPLNKQGTVLLDKAGNRVILKTKVVLREGLLEMLCCPVRTKEHESILAVDSRAYTIHAGLLALGAQPGSTVSYFPEFKPPTGQRIDIFVTWTDQKGQVQRKPAQSWIRYSIHRYYTAKFDRRPEGLRIPPESDLRFDEKHKELIWYGPLSAELRDTFLTYSADPKYREAIESFYGQSQPREMDTHWVFTGSGFAVDPNTGERHYEAEVGDLICVSNFPSSMIDVAIQSSSMGEENLLFEAYTERIPPEGTEVTLELIPVKGADAAEKKEGAK